MDVVQSGSYEELQLLANLRVAQFLQDTEHFFTLTLLI